MTHSSRFGMALDRVAPYALPALAFLLYVGTAIILEARQATTHFGADSWYYTEFAGPDVLARTVEFSDLDRVMRFHPVTGFLAIGWMYAARNLLPFIAPLFALKLLFAASGAVSVAAAVQSFLRLMPRREALLFAALFAVSFSSWYFASIEESKIITAALAGWYIAIYLRLRESWSTRWAVALTFVLLLACLNEIVSIFLVAIPAVDLLLRWELNFKQLRWLFLHALAGPVALLLVEGLLHGRVVAASHPEGGSHIGMFLAYMARNRYDLPVAYNFLINWSFFDIVAPATDAAHGVAPGSTYKGHLYKGYFESALSSYLFHPASLLAAILCIAVAVLVAMPRYRRAPDRGRLAIVAGLLAYSAIRCVFFFLFNPSEPLLFTPAVTLAHLVVLAAFVSASHIPFKVPLLGAVFAAVFIANGIFMLG